MCLLTLDVAPPTDKTIKNGLSLFEGGKHLRQNGVLHFG